MKWLPYIPLSLTLMSACVNPSSQSIPSILCEDKETISENISMKAFVQNITDKPTLIDENLVVSGYVVSDDRLGNFYKTIHLQNTDKTAALIIEIDGYDLYASYNVGRKIYVKLQGLAAQKQYGQSVIGNLSKTGTITEIASGTAPEALIRSCETIPENELAVPIQIKDINEALLGSLVEIENVQFVNANIGGSLHDAETRTGGTNRLIEDALGYNLILRTSGFSEFSSFKIPSQSGTIRGILTKYGQDYQIVLRYAEDLNLTQDRFFPKQISIAALRKKPEDQPLDTPQYIEGVVTMSGYPDAGRRNGRNISGRLAVIQDDTAAIALYFDAGAHQLMEGDLVRVNPLGLRLNVYAGQTRLQTIDANGRNAAGELQITTLSTGNPLPAPVEVTLHDLINGSHDLELVTVINAQVSAEYRGLTFSGDKTITDCDNVFQLNTRSASLFSKQTVPDHMGRIAGISSGSKELILKNTDWVAQMTNPRCDETTLLFEENFETAPENAPVFLTGWSNISNNSSQELLWTIKNFGGNKYAELSAYGQSQSFETWLISPDIDLSGKYDAYLRFRTKDGYNSGQTLSVYVSDNYNGANLSQATWQPLNARISNENYSGYGSTFIDSEKIDLSAYKGKINIGFKYTGTPPRVTTAMQLDEIQVFAK